MLPKKDHVEVGEIPRQNKKLGQLTRKFVSRQRKVRKQELWGGGGLSNWTLFCNSGGPCGTNLRIKRD